MSMEHMRYHDVITTLEQLQSGRIHPQLDSIRAIAEEFGNPQERYPSVHIAGTNGKGSVASLMASILKTAGYRTGLYTSPHIFDFCERIAIDGVPVSRQEVIDLAVETLPAISRLNCTYFEAATLFAFLYFARQGVDAAVIETGLGGGWDATNILRPAVAILTHIAVDHEKYLGSSLQGIAREKAGIIKTGGTCVLARQEPAVKAIIMRHAEAVNAALIDVEFEAKVRVTSLALGGSEFSYEFANGKIDGLRIPLAGIHQVGNAAAALTAAIALRDRGFRIGTNHLRDGIAGCRWPGRLETIQSRPLVIADVAHNPDAFVALRQACDTLLPGKKIILVFGVMKDKDFKGMLAAILPLCKAVIGMPLPGERALSPAGLSEIMRESRVPYVPCGSAADAVQTALQRAGAGDAILISGSHLTVDAAVSALQQRK